MSSWIITGHSDGKLWIWLKGKPYQKWLFHLKAITDIALVDLFNNDCYYGCEENYPFSHHHVITVGEDRNLITTSLVTNHKDCSQPGRKHVVVVPNHRDVLCSVRVFGNHLAVASKGNRVYLYVMETLNNSCFCLKISFIRRINLVRGPTDFLNTLGFWNSKVYCITQTSKLVVLENTQWKEKPYFKNKLNSNFGEGLIITAYYAFRDEVIIMFSADGKMIVSLPGERIATYSALQDLQTPVVSVALLGTTLALGGENGKIYVYHVPADESLLRMDLSRPDFSKRLGPGPIVSVHIEHQRSSLVVVASTKYMLFSVQWCRAKVQESRSDCESQPCSFFIFT